MRTVNSTDPIKVLGLQLRSYNSLRRHGIHTVGELIKIYNSGNLLSIRNLGEKSHAEITDTLNNVEIVDQNLRESTNINVDKSQESNLIEKSEDLKSIGQQKIFAELQKSLEQNIFLKNQTENALNILKKILKNQLDCGTLHPNAKIGEITVIDLLNQKSLADFNLLSYFSLVFRFANIAQECAYLFEIIPNNRYVGICFSRFGYEKKTLNNIAIGEGISRARVQQIENKIVLMIYSMSNHLLGINTQEARSIPLIRIQSALMFAEEMGLNISFENWTNQLFRSGLLGVALVKNANNFDFVEGLIAICRILSSKGLSEFTIPDNLNYAIQLKLMNKPATQARSLHYKENISQELKKDIKRHKNFSGAVNSNWLSKEHKISIDDLTNYLIAMDFFLINNNWFISKSIVKKDALDKNDCLNHSLQKMFQYLGPLEIAEICSGLRHAASKTEYPIPPPDVLEIVLEKSGYTKENHKWFWDNVLNENLNSGEKIIFKCFNELGPVLHHSELGHAFITSEYSFPLLHSTLNRSPLFKKIDRGFYIIRGKKYTPDDFNRAKQAEARIPLDLKVTYKKTGDIIIVFTVGLLSLGTGEITSEKLPNLEGSWTVYIQGDQVGTINVIGNSIRKLNKSFESVSCEVGDRIRLSFNTWKRSVQIEKESSNEY